MKSWHTYIIPGVGEDAAPADSHGLAVVSMSIGATSEGCEWSLIDSQAIILRKKINSALKHE